MARLSMEEVKLAKITYTKIVNDEFVLNLIETIEAQQQEIEKLKVQLGDAINILKDFAFVNTDESLAERSDAALKVHKFFNANGYKVSE